MPVLELDSIATCVCSRLRCAISLLRLTSDELSADKHEIKLHDDCEPESYQTFNKTLCSLSIAVLPVPMTSDYVDTFEGCTNVL